MTKLLTLLLACAIIQSEAQTTYSLQLFYNINETLPIKSFARVDSFCTALPAKPFKITITGYADFLNTDDYNLRLSQKRADVVKEHLLENPQAKRFTLVSCTGKGESTSGTTVSKKGEPAHRRVDIVAVMLAPLVTAKAGKPTKEKPLPVPAPKKDDAKPVKLEELKEGESLALEGLSFEPGRHFVLKSSLPVMEKLLETLKENNEMKVEIQGHICCAPGPEDALDFDTNDHKLSDHRAKTVYDYLVQNGISANRLTYKGYGHSMPKVRELTPEDEQINRRVEIKILGH